MVVSFWFCESFDKFDMCVDVWYLYLLHLDAENEHKEVSDSLIMLLLQNSETNPCGLLSLVEMLYPLFWNDHLSLMCVEYSELKTLDHKNLTKVNSMDL